MDKKESIFTLQFILLCFSGFLFFGSFNMIIPELPSYLTAMGGGEYKGLIIALFTVTAGLSRPFSGKLADKVGRVPVMVVGALVSSIAALLYPVVSGVIGFFALRFFHGFSTGFKPTGTSAYVADIVPFNRRGEAMGFVGFFSSLGMAAGPAIGAYLASHFSLNTMFYFSSGFALSSVLVLAGMKETLKSPEKLRLSHFFINKSELFEPKVITPSLVMMLSVFSFGTILTVIPDLSDHLQISNRGLFFTYFTIASLLVRIIAGKASDKFGRIPVLKVGGLILALSMILLANTEGNLLFVLSAVFFGFGMGICSPTIFAWTIDMSDEKHRGRGIATMYIALEVGIGLGAFISGWVFSNDINNIAMVFYIPAVLVLIGFFYLFTPGVKKLTLETVVDE
ncbi:MFS transporter [Reichenbachiella sp. MALMAid0571]|uniref:MFS transporter n=1 Tax=Reichenbachiella sp. MALMAid0571 TaxID=3143939 RepID=UPI0032DED0DD